MSVAVAPRSAPPPPVALRLAPAFADAVRSVVPTMVGLTVEVGPPAPKADDDAATPRFDVSGIVGFSGEVAGSLVVRLPMPVAAELVAGLTGGPCPPPASSDFADAVGELANMVAGAAKARFGLSVSMTVPVVVVGPAHAVPRLSGVPTLTIPCACPLGAFVLEVNLTERPAT